MRTTAVFVLLYLVGITAAPARATVISDYWETFSNQPYNEPAYPDTNVWYERMRFRINAADDVALKITARRPAQATYFGYAVYNQRTGSRIGSQGALARTDITSDDAESYTAYAVSDATLAQWAADQPAFRLYAKSDHDRYIYLELWYRIYAHRGRDRPPLPTVEAVDPVDLTTSRPPPVRMVAHQPSALVPYSRCPPPGINNEINFYRAENINGLYANPHTNYLVTRLSHPQGSRDAGVIRFREPPVPDWSVCMIGGLLQQTGACLSKTTAVRDGHDIVIVMGRTDPRSPAERSRYNYLPWTRFRLGSGILYRNVMQAPGENYSFAQVPALPEAMNSQDAAYYAAHQWIGPYAPRGKQCQATYRTECHWRRMIGQLE